MTFSLVFFSRSDTHAYVSSNRFQSRLFLKLFCFFGHSRLQSISSLTTRRLQFYNYFYRCYVVKTHKFNSTIFSLEFIWKIITLLPSQSSSKSNWAMLLDSLTLLVIYMRFWQYLKKKSISLDTVHIRLLRFEIYWVLCKSVGPFQQRKKCHTTFDRTKHQVQSDEPIHLAARILKYFLKNAFFPKSSDFQSNCYQLQASKFHLFVSLNWT